jgi:hypothetical protein
MSPCRLPIDSMNTGRSLRCASACATVMNSLWTFRPRKRVVALGMVHVGSEVSAAVQRAALAPTAPTRECAGGQPHFAPEVMMSRRAGLQSTRRSSPSSSQFRDPPPAQVESVLLSARERVVPRSPL